MSKIEDFKSNGTPLVAVPFKVQPRSNDAKYSVTSTVQVIYEDGKLRYKYPDGRTCEHPDGIAHDCLYVDQRNRLIPRAASAAHSAQAKPEAGPGTYERVFMATMTELWGTR